MSWLSNIPILFALPLFAAIFAGVAVGAHSALRPLLPPPERLSEHHEVPGFLMGVVGVLYSVVLGFLVGTVWTAFATAQQTTDLEAGYIADAFNFAGQLPPRQGKLLQRLIAQYAVDVRGQDWSSPQAAGDATTAALLYRAFRITTSILALQTNAGSGRILETNNITTAEIASLRQIADARRLRFVQSQSRLPAGLLEALILGAMGVVTFTFLFGVRSYTKQMLMTGLLAGSIGLFFGLVVELSTPYAGAIHVSRESLNFVIANNRMEQAAK
jgi:H+/Cl- antiporter ClcA